MKKSIYSTPVIGHLDVLLQKGFAKSSSLIDIGAEDNEFGYFDE